MEPGEIAGCSKAPVSQSDYMGFLTTLKNLDKDFVRDTIVKLLENVMKGEQSTTTRKQRRRQASRLPKRIRVRKRLQIKAKDKSVSMRRKLNKIHTLKSEGGVL